ncbi:glycosyl transferase family 1 [Methylosinus trichosporium OB3b]|uniref:Glycosyl transferase family 1 n=1 Tax=Methylosinus trichosporium (strain ATCC 35070 / NCIMB 11131 / UNIQEM 75 / OB3b) TaxID=595536 RepID=A0A2D2D081_METT3|nr:glycosyltransferase family 1 protein [Methylosinus trichosporium]ATQ68354.1 glycosyl transferase family 1 [Methylosinus trichosporium OB3b]
MSLHALTAAPSTVSSGGERWLGPSPEREQLPAPATDTRPTPIAAQLPSAEDSCPVEARIALLEHQLGHARAEMLHLLHERHLMTYSAAGHIYRPLRRIEALLVGGFHALRGALRRRHDICVAAAAAPAPAPRAPALARCVEARRLLVDVTATVRYDAGTGIQRVAKMVTQALYRDAAPLLPAIAVRCEGGRLLTCRRFVASLCGDAATAEAEDEEIVLAPGDYFLTLADTWNVLDEYARVFDRVHEAGGAVVSCIFDLIPALHPGACHHTTPARYESWLARALVESDAFLAISRTVAQELADFVEARGLPHRRGLKIGWFPLGSEISCGPATAPRKKIAAAVGPAPLFLCVGTIEPRKGQRVALRAFDALWREGRDIRLVFVGRRGWCEEAVVAEIAGHAEYQRRLFWFDDANDAELAFLYDHATAALAPSFAEGFGLPIAEAARRGRPTICSDIPVFREVGGAGALYFAVTDPSALAARVADLLDGRASGDPAATSRASWTEAAHRIVSVIAKDDWSHELA